MAKSEKEPQRTAGQRATHDAAVVAQREVAPEAVKAPEEAPVAVPEPAPVREGPEAWPVAAALPGDGERVAAILREVGQVTDVGSLATVLRGVVNQATKCRVQPDVLKGLLTP